MQRHMIVVRMPIGISDVFPMDDKSMKTLGRMRNQ